MTIIWCSLKVMRHTSKTQTLSAPYFCTTNWRIWFFILAFRKRALLSSPMLTQHDLLSFMIILSIQSALFYVHSLFFFFASTLRTELVDSTAFWGRHHKIYPVQLDRVLFLFLFSASSHMWGG